MSQNGLRSAGLYWKAVVASALMVASCNAGESTPPKIGSAQEGKAVPSDPQGSNKPGTAHQAARKVAAKVNGEAIYESQVNAGMPKHAFAEQLQTARENKLDRLIHTMSARQFLKGQNVEVDQKDIDAEIAKLKENPPSAGCTCCRYKSLEEYLTLNCITRPELVEMCWTQLGMDKYLDAQWQKAYPSTEDVAKLLKTARPGLARKYVKAYHIFFNTSQDPDFENDSGGVEKKKMKLAEAAWARLKKGEAFAAVAKAVSEDQMNAKDGGYLGYIPADAFGKEVGKVLTKLKPGTYSEPVLSPWGVHIIKREPLADDDLLSLLKDDFKNNKADETFDQIDRTAKIERADDPSAGRPAPGRPAPTKSD